MWAHVLAAPGRFETVDVAAPSETDVSDDEVLLRALVGGICGSDLPAFRGTRHRDPRDLGGWAGNVPGLPLHEIVGEVLVSRHPEHRVGDLAVGWASRFDGITELVLADGEGLYACRGTSPSACWRATPSPQRRVPEEGRTHKIIDDMCILIY